MKLSKAEAYEWFLKKGFTSQGEGQWSKAGANVDGNRSRVQEQQGHHPNAQEGKHQSKASISVRPNDEEGISGAYGHDGKQFQITAHFYFSDNRGRDGDGAYSTVQDVLKHAGAILDDKWQIIPKFQVECWPCAKGEERVEVTIEELE